MTYSPRWEDDRQVRVAVGCTSTQRWMPNGVAADLLSPLVIRGSPSLLELDLTAMLGPKKPVAVQAGQTWESQAWHRDMSPAANDRLTDVVSVTLQ